MSLPTDKQMENTDPAVEYLLSTLGIDDTIEVLEAAVPVISGFEKSLRESLLAGDLAAASRIAHRAAGSVRLYGSERLEQLLHQVKDQQFEDGNVSGIQRELSDELRFVSGRIQQWLASQPA